MAHFEPRPDPHCGAVCWGACCSGGPTFQVTSGPSDLKLQMPPLMNPFECPPFWSWSRQGICGGWARHIMLRTTPLRCQEITGTTGGQRVGGAGQAAEDFWGAQTSPAAAAHHAVIPKHPGRADLSIVTHQAETALPVSRSALPSQGHPQGHAPGKRAQILDYHEGSNVLGRITLGKVITPPFTGRAFPSAGGLHSA